MNQKHYLLTFQIIQGEYTHSHKVLFKSDNQNMANCFADVLASKWYDKSKHVDNFYVTNDDAVAVKVEQVMEIKEVAFNVLKDYIHVIL